MIAGWGNCHDRLTAFLQRYLPHFYRAEQRRNAALVIRGLLSGLPRKTCEPIAVEAGVHRKPIQFFVGAGKWDDEAVMAELRAHVREELADGQAILILDPSSFPKSGSESCGVARQGRQLPGRRLPGLRRSRRLRAAGPAALPAQGLGGRSGPPGEVPRPRGRRVPGVVADRRGPPGAMPRGVAPRLGGRR